MMRGSVQWSSTFFLPLAFLSKHMIDAKVSRIMNLSGYGFII